MSDGQRIKVFPVLPLFLTRYYRVIGMANGNKEIDWKARAQEAERALVWHERQLQDHQAALLRTVQKLVPLVDLPGGQGEKLRDAVREAVIGAIDIRALDAGLARLSEAVVKGELVQSAPPPAVSDSHLQTMIEELARVVPRDSAAALELSNYARQMKQMRNTDSFRVVLDQLREYLLSLIQHGHRIEGKCSRLIVHVLHQLFERLNLPSELQQELAEMRLVLEKGFNEETWDLVLRKVGEIASEFRRRMYVEREDTEQFLVEITNRLNQLDSYVRSSAEYTDAALENGREFGVSMRSEIDGISHTLKTSTDLVQLKGQIKQRLEALEFRLTLFLDEETERNETARGQVQALIGLLKDMDGETTKLRQKIKRQQLQSMLDPLTSVSNRMAYNERIREEVARANRYQQPLTLLVWDIDFFKKINDTFGHVAGDNALKGVAKLLSERIRETDFLARYGGEEFVLLLPNTGMIQALATANQLRELVSAAKFHFQGKPVSITISAGASQYRQGDTAETLFERADQALYRAKQAGRNRVIAAE